MTRPISKVAPDWWDYTTLEAEIVDEAARLTPEDMLRLSREGFRVVFYDTLEEFYAAEALEYIEAWRKSTPDNPAGICGPIGPTEQLPLVARMVNALELNLADCHFWGMDEWVEARRRRPPAEFRTHRPRNVLRSHFAGPGDAGGEHALPIGRPGCLQPIVRRNPLPCHAGRAG